MTAPTGRPRGRPHGSRNRAKVALEEAQAAAEAALTASLSPEAIAALSPLQTMLAAMAVHASRGQWTMAATIARDAAPYCHPRKAPEPPPAGSGDIDPAELIAGDRDPEVIDRGRASGGGLPH